MMTPTSRCSLQGFGGGGSGVGPSKIHERKIRLKEKRRETNTYTINKGLVY